MKRSTSAYTLIEVLVAAAILVIAVSAAAALAVATIAQEEVSSRVARCLNLHEQAVRLYQLGLDPGTLSALLPADPAVVSLVFTAPPNLSIAGLGTVEQADSTIIFETTTGGATRTHTMTAIRPWKR
jgi:type II secretory pathway pseudopilin PulG